MRVLGLPWSPWLCVSLVSVAMRVLGLRVLGLLVSGGTAFLCVSGQVGIAMRP